jgi:amino acid transporter
MATAENAGTASAGVQEAVFSRNATGLVRLGTPWRIIVLNFANIGLTYVMFTYWITPAVFPQSNLYLSLLIAGLVNLVFAGALAIFTSAFPRSGGEYIYVSRSLHPAIGFACSVAAALSQAFWVGIGGYWIATLVLSPVLTSIGISTDNATLVNWGTDFGTANWGFVTGTIAVVICGLLNLTGLRGYFRFQTANFVIGTATFLLLVGLFVTSSHSDFASGLNSWSSAAGGSPTAFEDITAGAQAAGMPGGTTLRDTLGVAGVTFLIAFASASIAGEIRTPKRTQLVGTVGGTALYTTVAIALFAAITVAVPESFNKAAAWMNYNSADYATILPGQPTFITWASVLTSNTLLLVLIGVGLVIWSYFWLPSAMIIATRNIFAWSLDRLAPAKLSEVSERTHSPIWATLTVTVVAEAFLIAYWQSWFTYLTPFLAYAAVFFVVGIAAIVAGFRPSTREYLAKAGWDRKIGGVPLLTICGAAGVLYWGIALYFAYTVDLLFLNTNKQLILTAVQFIAPFVLFFAIAAWRRRTGIRVDAAYKVLPPE